LLHLLLELRIFKSIDFGRNWLPIQTGLSKNRVWRFAYLETLNRLYAVADDGVYFQTLDVTAPTAITLQLNAGSDFTNKSLVFLTLNALEADSMLIAENKQFKAITWQPFKQNYTTILSTNDGPKNVYALFKDISYNLSDTLQASITLDTTPPVNPTALISHVSPGRIARRDLSWQKSTDATSGVDRYRINLSQVRDFSGVTTVRDSVFASDNPGYTTPTLANAIWYWNVVAIDKAGNFSFSQTDSFVVNLGTTPSAPTIQIAAPVTNDNTPTIAWAAVDGAEKYRLEYDTNPNFANAINIPDIITPGYTFTQALPDSAYYFRAFSVNASDLESVASLTAQLTIDTQPPQNPDLQFMNITDYSKTPNLGLRLSANNADSVRLLGDLTENKLSRFQLFDLENQVNTQGNVTLTMGDGAKNIQAQFKDRAGNIANVFRSVFLDTREPVFPTNTPQLSVAVPGLNQSVTISLTAPDDGNGSGLKDFALYYRHTGEAWDNQNKALFQNNLAGIPAPFVTNSGFDYQIVAEDSARNRTFLQNGPLDFFSIPVALGAGEAGSSAGLPGGTGGADYRLVSLPMVAQNKPVSEVFSNLGAYGDKNDYRFWKFSGGNDWREGADIVVQPGESYFLIKRESGSLSNSTTGTTATTSDAASGNITGWQLRASDWSLIGNPFNLEIPLTDFRLKNRDTSLVFVTDVWAYEGSSLNNGWTQQNLRLSPWGGLAVFNDGNADMLIYVPPNSGSSPGNLPTINQPLVEKTNMEKMWQVRIRAESNGFQDNENYFGVAESAEVGRDAFDRFEPPFLPGGVSLSFDPEDTTIARNLATDMQPSDQTGYSWSVKILGSGGSIVHITFDESGETPAELELFLIDHRSRILRNIRQQREIDVYLPNPEGIKTLILLAGDREYIDEHASGLQETPANFILEQNYPNPFNPTTVIRFALPAAGKVSLIIYNLLGEEIIKLTENEFHNAGYYEKVLDLSGFASGIYFYHLSVSGEQRFRTTRKMVLAK
jgi:hypothetical protein